jgi:hypothetical protein
MLHNPYVTGRLWAKTLAADEMTRFDSTLSDKDFQAMLQDLMEEGGWKTLQYLQRLKEML